MLNYGEWKLDYLAAVHDLRMLTGRAWEGGDETWMSWDGKHMWMIQYSGTRVGMPCKNQRHGLRA